MHHTIFARNVQQALPAGLDALKKFGIREQSRAGDVLRFPGPVVTVLERPQERVIFHPWRDANPFFHIVEAAWMLAGRNTLADLTPYVKNMANFSDDGGVTQPGAYGKRWRSHLIDAGSHVAVEWGDQLNWAVRRLRANPGDRRVVIQMWDAYTDIEAAEAGGKDVPCNLTMLPWVMDDRLHLSIFNRSNDIIWGLYGANAVHFSVALEYLAGRLGLGVGTMTTFSNNFHVYVDKLPSEVPDICNIHDPYARGEVDPFNMFFWWGGSVFPDDLCERFMQEDLAMFFEHGPVEALQTARWPWLRRVLVPMALAHQRHRGPQLGRYEGAQSIAMGVAATDWRRAASEWLERRHGSASQG